MSEMVSASSVEMTRNIRHPFSWIQLDEGFLGSPEYRKRRTL